MNDNDTAGDIPPRQMVTLTIRISRHTMSRLEDLQEATKVKKTVIAREGILLHLANEESKVFNARKIIQDMM